MQTEPFWCTSTVVKATKGISNFSSSVAPSSCPHPADLERPFLGLGRLPIDLSASRCRASARIPHHLWSTNECAAENFRENRVDTTLRRRLYEPLTRLDSRIRGALRGRVASDDRVDALLRLQQFLCVLMHTS